MRCTLTKKIALVLLVFASTNIRSQDFLGIRQSNYSGITGIDMNPAMIADSRFKFDMNLGGFSLAGYNNYLGFSGSDIRNMMVNSFSNKPLDSVAITERVNDQSKSMLVANDIHLPSVLVSLNEESAVAFTWKLRTFVNIDGLEPPLAKLILEELEWEELWKDTITNKNLSIQTMTWAEYGVGYGRVLYDEEEHFIKVGGRVKLLQGIQAGYMYIDDLEYSFWNDDSVSFFNSDVEYGHSDNFDPARINSVGEFVDAYTFTGRPSVGLDIGVIYEWRPEWQDHKYEMDGRDNLWRKNTNKYKLRAGFAVNDIGRIKFTKGYLSRNFNADVSLWDISSIDWENVEEMDDTLVQRFQDLPQDEGEFKMNLPLNFNLHVDYQVYKDFYVNAQAFLAPRFNKDKNKTHHFTNFSITPRYDFTWAGLSIPVSYSNYAGFRLGAALRAGPVFIGTGDIRPFFGKGTIYGGDIFMALKVPIPYGHPKDTDGDHVSDKFDDCKEIPGVWAFKGCPDTDGDMIQDSEDDCPAEAGLVEFGGCPDSDRDGIPDKKDDCPLTAGLEEFKGCPDTDEDGIKDSEDKCPEIAGIAEFEGCPDTDNDGLQDSDDNCPEEAGPIDNLGCPVDVKVHLVDKYGNIIATAGINQEGVFVFENLPLDENYLFLLDGVDPEIEDELKIIIRNEDGDHEIIAQLEESGFFVYRHLEEEETEIEMIEEEDTKLIVLLEEEEEVLKKAFDNLEFSTAKAIIKESSYESLNELVDLLKKKPEWRIKIAGHTDNVGSAANNLLLSKRRAEAVAHYLKKRGIEEDRIVVKFFGESQPVADNETEEGRQKNRRVEMTIME